MQTVCFVGGLTAQATMVIGEHEVTLNRWLINLIFCKLINSFLQVASFLSLKIENVGSRISKQ